MMKLENKACMEADSNIKSLEANLRNLEKSLKEITEANEAKTRFLFNMSHDIRTPMNSIIGFTDIALKHLDDTDRVKDCLLNVRAAGSHLIALINDILDMSRIESGSVNIVENRADIYRCGEEINTMLTSLAKSKDISYEISYGEIYDRFIYVDILHMNQVIVNLVSNAIKYTPEGGRVTFEVNEIKRHKDNTATYEFVVSDNGIGMSPEFLDHMFEQFSRENTSIVTQKEGVGLGLAITKRLVDLMGGEIEVESTVGEGTKFTIRLRTKLQDEDEIEDVRTKPSRIQKKLSGKRVLLAEDNELNREIVIEILSSEGMSVDEAENGAVAIEMLKEKEPGYYSCILMDIQMPVMGGYEATRCIRGLGEYGKNIPIIALSANAFNEDRRESILYGMNNHVAKPISVDELLNAIKDVV